MIQYDISNPVKYVELSIIKRHRNLSCNNSFLLLQRFSIAYLAKPDFMLTKAPYSKTRYLVCIIVATFTILEGFTQKSNSRSPISSQAFSKMMVDYYNFALIGSQTPTTGLKVETNKPSITLKGNIIPNYNKSFLLNLELEGGLDNGLMQLLSGKDVSNYFKVSVGANFLLTKNKASRFVITRTEQEMTDNAHYNNRMLLSRQLDTFVIIKTISDDFNFSGYDFDRLILAVLAERKNSIYKIENLQTNNGSAYFKQLIAGILVQYGTPKNANDDSLLINFKSYVKNDTNTVVQFKKLLQDYDRIKDDLLKEAYTLNNKQYDSEILLTTSLWTWKKIRWVNFSATAYNNNFKLFYPMTNLLIDSSSFLPGLTGSFNWLKKGKENVKFIYFRLGATVQKTNSLLDLQKFNYKKEVTLVVNPGEDLKDTKEGVAYLGELKHKIGVDIFFEGYTVPWKNNFVPGFYAKAIYRNSEAWINKNKIVLDLGTVWNIASSDGNAKNLLSIVPFVSWSNLLEEYKDVGKKQKKKTSDLISLNVKFGIPINLSR